MTKRDFFRIIIKLFALYSIILTVFNWIPSNLMYTIYDFELIPIVSTLGFSMLAFLIYYVLITKTDKIIDFLKIDKGFDDKNIEIGNLNSEKILMLGIILIGGLLIISNLSDFIQCTFVAFKKEISKGKLYTFFDNDLRTANNHFNWIFS